MRELEEVKQKRDKAMIAMSAIALCSDLDRHFPTVVVLEANNKTSGELHLLEEISCRQYLLHI